jgi:hypothetical protein
MNLRSITASLLLSALLLGGLAACGGIGTTAADTTTTSSNPTAASATAAGAATDTALAVDDPGPGSDEIAGLVFMREEEKLARDVYLTLHDLWDTPVFENIAASEERHTTAVAGLLEDFGIPDPVTDEAVGAFADPALAALYDDLVEQGSLSLTDALAVGALIEDLDIADLRKWLELTDDPDIERVYENLLRGSENHLRAFTGRLEAEGRTYTATYLTQDEIDEILADGARGKGKGHGGKGQRKGRRA